MEAAQSTVKKPVENDLFVWQGPSRPFKTRTREYYVTLFAMTGLVGLVLFIAEGAMPVVLLIAIVFLYYVLSTVKPDDIEYKITNLGIKIAGTKTAWDNLGRFWFIKRMGANLLVVETFSIPGRLELVVKEEDVEKVKKTLSEYLNEEEIQASGVEKVTDWISTKLPGNN